MVLEVHDFGLSELVQCLIDFRLSVICSNEDRHVLHACSDEAGEKPFARCKLEGLLKDLLVDRESIADNRSVIWSW